MVYFGVLKQHSADDRIRTIRLTSLGTKAVTGGAWSADPVGFTVGANSSTADSISCLLGGGVSGTTYRITATATLDSGENVTGLFDIEVDDG